MARKASLDIVLFEVPGSGTSYLLQAPDTTFEAENVLDNGKSMADRWDLEEVVRRGSRISGSVLIDVTGVRQTNLNLSTFTIGGTALVADVRSARVTGNTTIKEGAGARDAFKQPHAVGTSLRIAADLLINEGAGLQNADLVKRVGAGTLADQKLAYSIVAGGVSIAGNGILESAEHVLETEELQVYRMSMNGRGEPTVSGHPFLVSLLTGTSATSFAYDSGGNNYSGTLVFSSVDLDIPNEGLLRCNFIGEVFDTPTITYGA
jgi:hypothetical protein